MGQRSSTGTIVGLLKAFLDQRTWTQADLARKLGVSSATVHKRVVELRVAGVPLVDEKEHPHVYWSVPKDWYPGGVLFTGDQITDLLRLLARVPKGVARNRLIARLLKYLPGREATAAVVAPETTAREERHLPVIEDCATQKVALRFRYFTVTTGKEGTRHASVHRVVYGPPARFLATCHRTDTLKWFRVESVSAAELDKRVPFRDVDSKTVDAHMRASLDGFHKGGSPVVKHEFFVRDPEARWVARNVLGEMRTEEAPGGIRVTVETAALERLARYVVALGAAGTPRTPELEAAVERLAKGALASIAAGREGGG